MHPGVNRVHALAWRRWRRKLFDRETWHAMGELRAQLRAQPLRLRARPAGADSRVRCGAGRPRARWWATTRASGRDPLAAWLYARKAAVSLRAARGRALPAPGRRPPGLPGARARAPVFGIVPGKGSWKLRSPASAALIPCASRPEKIWPEARWITVGKRLKAMGLSPVVIWGTEEEQVRAERIAAGCEGEVPPFLNVHDMAALLAQTQARHWAGHRVLASGGRARPADHRHLLRPRAGAGGHRRPGRRGQHRRQGPGAFAGRRAGAGGAAARAGLNRAARPPRGCVYSSSMRCAGKRVPAQAARALPEVLWRLEAAGGAAVALQRPGRPGHGLAHVAQRRLVVHVQRRVEHGQRGRQRGLRVQQGLRPLAGIGQAGLCRHGTVEQRASPAAGRRWAALSCGASRWRARPRPARPGWPRWRSRWRSAGTTPARAAATRCTGRTPPRHRRPERHAAPR